MLIEIHDKVRHVGTICRVAILTDQIGPKRVEMSAKTGTNKKKMTQSFIFLFANETKGTFCVSQPRIPSIQSETSNQPNLSMKTAGNCSEIDQNLRGGVFSRQACAMYRSVIMSVINRSHAKSFKFSNFAIHNSFPCEVGGKRRINEPLVKITENAIFLKRITYAR